MIIVRLSAQPTKPEALKMGQILSSFTPCLVSLRFYSIVKIFYFSRNVSIEKLRYPFMFEHDFTKKTYEVAIVFLFELIFNTEV